MSKNKLITACSLLLFTSFICSCVFDPTKMYPSAEKELTMQEKPFTYVFVSGIKTRDNEKIKNLLKNTDKMNGRKIALFSVDGVLLNKVPYSAADEALFEYAKLHPDWKPDLVKNILSCKDHNSIEYSRDRAIFWAGLPLNEVEKFGYDVLHKHYKFYAQTFSLLGNLKSNNFEVWIITSAPEALYQKFMSVYLGIPKTRIIGVRNLIRDGIVTDTIALPNMNSEGKAEAVETIIKAKPLIAIGGSINDIDMMKLATGLRIAVNPDNKTPVKSLNNEYFDIYAQDHNWMILDISDIADARMDEMVAREFGLTPNKAIEL